MNGPLYWAIFSSVEQIMEINIEYSTISHSNILHFKKIYHLFIYYFNAKDARQCVCKNILFFLEKMEGKKKLTEQL